MLSMFCTACAPADSVPGVTAPPNTTASENASAPANSADRDARVDPSRPSVSDDDEYLIYKDTQKAFQFRYPKDWTVEELKEENVLLIMAPEAEANWQTNVFIEIREQTEAELPLEEVLDALLIHLPDFKEGFTLKSKDVITTTTGLAAGVLTYEHDPEIGLFEKEYIIPWDDNKMLYATGSAVIALREKYESPVNRILDSIDKL